MENSAFKALWASSKGFDTEIRTGMDPDTLARSILDHLYYAQAKLPENASKLDWYLALAYSVRDRMLRHLIRMQKTYKNKKLRIVSYLSAEFLLGPHLGNALLCLGMFKQAEKAVSSLGLNLNELLEEEEEPGLGNGGLGRLAACYLDSLATLEVPAIGYGIRYEFGIFDQEIRDGWQMEKTDKWLHYGNPWEIERHDLSYPVKLGGRTESHQDKEGRLHTQWFPNRVVRGIACDTPIIGYLNKTTNILRLWKAEAEESFDFQAFNVGDYYGAVQAKVMSENITKVLYPNDDQIQGKQLRLEQQYFFVSCALQDMIRMHLAQERKIETFHEHFAVQLNDTHPSIGIAELMRILVDDYFMEWDKAWNITRLSFAYTNHTLLPEALERWPVPLFASVLPRHLEIIYEINCRFLEEVKRRKPQDDGLISRVSLIDESHNKYIRMAHLACIGSHSINGVAALHTELLKASVLCDFNTLFPGKFQSVTNGISPRRWLLLSNPRLCELLSGSLGKQWPQHLEEDLLNLTKLAADSGFQKDWRAVKNQNKKDLAKIIKDRTGQTVDPESLFDIQVKRIHEYKRQHLNILHVITLYNRLRENPKLETVPRTVIFGGKAAPGYFAAKLIIKLINAVAETVNHDPKMKNRLKVIFLPDFNVKLAQHIYPAADLSEQISTAGMEASGTGNMKFAINGALTIGTLDGANIEIRQAVGKENFFLFGLNAEEVMHLKRTVYRPEELYRNIPALKTVLDQIRSGYFSEGDTGVFSRLVDSLLSHDPYLLLADYQSYMDCQARVALTYRSEKIWTQMAILNVARMGYFSSDRSIREYCEKIWQIKPGAPDTSHA